MNPSLSKTPRLSNPSVQTSSSLRVNMAPMSPRLRETETAASRWAQERSCQVLSSERTLQRSCWPQNFCVTDEVYGHVVLFKIMFDDLSLQKALCRCGSAHFNGCLSAGGEHVGTRLPHRRGLCGQNASCQAAKAEPKCLECHPTQVRGQQSCWQRERQVE